MCRILTGHINYKHHKTENIIEYEHLLLLTALFVLIFMSCQSTKKNNAERQNEVELVAEKQLAFPLDEQTYYLSISIYQFEENGRNTFTLKIHENHYMTSSFLYIENKQIAKPNTSSTRQVPTELRQYMEAGFPRL